MYSIESIADSDKSNEKKNFSNATRCHLIQKQILNTRWKTVLNNLIVLNKQDNNKKANDGKEKEKSPVKYATRTDFAAYFCRRESVNELKEKKLKKYYN